MFIAIVNAAAVTTIGLTLNTPLAPLVGVWSGLWNIVPQIGGFMGGATLVALSLTRGLGTGLMAVTIFLVYQQLENNVIQPLITGRTIKISPLASMTAVLAGAAAGGFVGALLANPLVAITKAFFNEYRLRTELGLPRRRGPEAIEEVRHGGADLRPGGGLVGGPSDVEGGLVEGGQQ